MDTNDTAPDWESRSGFRRGFGEAVAISLKMRPLLRSLLAPKLYRRDFLDERCKVLLGKMAARLSQSLRNILQYSLEPRSVPDV